MSYHFPVWKSVHRHQSSIAGHDTQAHGMRRRQLRDSGLRGALVSVMRLRRSSMTIQVGCWVTPKCGEGIFVKWFWSLFLGGWAENSLEVWNSHLFENILLGNDISLYDEWIWVGMVGAIGAMPLGINAMGTIGWWWWCNELLCLCCFLGESFGGTHQHLISFLHLFGLPRNHEASSYVGNNLPWKHWLDAM